MNFKIKGSRPTCPPSRHGDKRNKGSEKRGIKNEIVIGRKAEKKFREINYANSRAYVFMQIFAAPLCEGWEHHGVSEETRQTTTARGRLRVRVKR